MRVRGCFTAVQTVRMWRGGGGGGGGIRQAGREGREGRVGRQTEAERSEMTGEQVGGWRNRAGCACVGVRWGGGEGVFHQATLGGTA